MRTGISMIHVLFIPANIHYYSLCEGSPKTENDSSTIWILWQRMSHAWPSEITSKATNSKPIASFASPLLTYESFEFLPKDLHYTRHTTLLQFTLPAIALNPSQTPATSSSSINLCFPLRRNHFPWSYRYGAERDM
jgi:hypothetical protein